MQDESGAQVAPAGSSRSIMPADNGGVATQPRAPGHDEPLATPAWAPGHGRLCASHCAPGHDQPPAAQSSVPGHDRPRAALATVSAHDRPHVTHPPPGHDRSRRAPAAGSRPTLVTHPTAPGQVFITAAPAPADRAGRNTSKERTP